MEEKFDNLGDVAKHIKEEGLPSEESMRIKLDREREKKFAEDINLKITEHKRLFDKWKGGGATEEEISKMTALSAEIKKETEEEIEKK